MEEKALEMTAMVENESNSNKTTSDHVSFVVAVVATMMGQEASTRHKMIGIISFCGSCSVKTVDD